MGAGAALIMPATLSLLVSVFEDERERATAVGIWAATAGVGVALGPVVGGLLLDRFWWGSIFIVNVPLCALAIVVGRRVMPESRDPVARRLDWTGAALSGAGLIALVWAVIEAPSDGWASPAVLAAGGLAVLLLGAFVLQQRRAAAPLLDVHLFRNPRFSAASAMVMVLFFALFGFLFVATQYLQFVLGLSPTAAGVRVLPYALAMIVFATASGEARRAPRDAAGRHAGDAAVRDGPGRRRHDRRRHRLRPPGVRIRADGRRDGARGRARDRVDHERAPSVAGQRRIGGQRHDTRARGRARRRGRGQRDGLALHRRRPRRGRGREEFVGAMSTASGIVAAVAVVGAMIAWRHLPRRAAPATRAGAVTDLS
jgi:hypothetical protein